MRTREFFCDGWKFHRGDIDLPHPRDKSALYVQSKTELLDRERGASCPMPPPKCASMQARLAE